MSDSTDLPIETPDEAFLRAMSGASFGKNSKVVLPSGAEITGEEVQVFSSAFAKREHETSRPGKHEFGEALSFADLPAIASPVNEVSRRRSHRRRTWWKIWN